MNRFRWQNVAVLCLGICIAAVGAFRTEAGVILRHGAGIAVAVFFVIKGASKLRCKMSDVLLGCLGLCFIILSKAVPSNWVTPVVFEVGLLIVVAIYIFTGLSYKAIIMNQKGNRGA